MALSPEERRRLLGRMDELLAPTSFQQQYESADMANLGKMLSVLANAMGACAIGLRILADDQQSEPTGRFAVVDREDEK